MDKKKAAIIGGVVAILVIGGVAALAASGGNDQSKTKNPAPTTESSTQSTTPSQDSGGTAESTNKSTTTTTVNGSSTTTTTTNNQTTITIEAGNYYFSPKTIKVSKGSKVTIKMTTKDMTHNFNIDALNVQIPDTSPGQTNSVTFTANQTGSFEFYCSIGNHRKLGQVGTLTVE